MGNQLIIMYGTIIKEVNEKYILEIKKQQEHLVHKGSYDTN